MSTEEVQRLHRTLADMGERCQEIRRAIRGDWGRIESDEVVGAATLYHLHVIGEAATSRLPEWFKGAHAEINWRGWAHFRHLTTHGYDRIDLGPLCLEGATEDRR